MYYYSLTLGIMDLLNSDDGVAMVECSALFEYVRHFLDDFFVNPSWGPNPGS